MRFKQDMFFDLNVLDQNIMVRLTTSDQEHKRLADYGDCDIYMHLTTKEEKINSIIFEQFQIIYDFLNDRKQSGKKKDRPYKIKITTPEPESVSLYLRRSNSTKDLPINFLIELIDRLLDYLDYELDVNKQDDISENYKKQNQDEEEQQLNVYNGQVSHTLPLNEEQSEENFKYRDEYFNQNKEFKKNYDNEYEDEEEENPFLNHNNEDSDKEEEEKENNDLLNHNNEDNDEEDFKEKNNNHYEYEEDEENNEIMQDDRLDLNEIENLSDEELDEKQIKEDINSIQKRFDNEVFTSIKEDYQDVDLNSNIEIPLFDPDGNNFYDEKTIKYEEDNEDNEDEEDNIFTNATNAYNKSINYIGEGEEDKEDNIFANTTDEEDEEDNIFANTTKVKDELEKDKAKINKTEEEEDEEEFWNQSQK